jgi:hypothetical protein
MSYTGSNMALYSWFNKNNEKPNKKSVRANNNLLKASQSAKYIENYTMWPTAKMKQSIEATLPMHDHAENKLAKEPDALISTLDKQTISLEAALTVNK